MKLVGPKGRQNSTCYDIAIAYGDMPEILTYVLESVRAERKIAWIHNAHPVSVFDRVAYGKEYQAYDLVGACSAELSASLTKMLAPFGVNVMHFPHILNRETYFALAKEMQPLDKTGDFLNIVSVGRVCGQKGFDIAIKVCGNLIRDGIRIHWHVVGDGSDIESLKKMVDQDELGQYFHFVGLKANPYPYIYNCDIYVQPSRYEGYCLTLAEARLLEKPIVTTDFIGAKEQIEHGVTGLIVKCNITALTEMVRKLACNPQLRSEFSKNLHRRYLADSNNAQIRDLLLAQHR